MDHNAYTQCYHQMVSGSGIFAKPRTKQEKMGKFVKNEIKSVHRVNTKKSASCNDEKFDIADISRFP